MTAPTKSPEAVATAPEAQKTTSKSIVAHAYKAFNAMFSTYVTLGDLLPLALVALAILVGVLL